MIFFAAGCPPLCKRKRIPGRLEKTGKASAVHTDSGLLRRGGLHGHAWCYAAAFVAG